jgi:hypothetical protein
MTTVPLSVSPEFVAAGSAIGSIIADVVAKKTAAVVAGDALPNLIAAVGEYSAFATDIKLVDNQVYLLRCILLAVEPAAPAAPAA